MTYLNSCVNWPTDQLDLLFDIQEAGEKRSLSWMLKTVGREGIRYWALCYGYETLAQLARDPLIGYYKAIVDGKMYCYIEWSAIEFVFAEDPVTEP